jgi:hypothetical protein
VRGRAVIHLLLVFFTTTFFAYGAVPFRPFTGSGLLIIPPSSTDKTAPLSLTLYEQPGVTRIRAISVGELPGLATVLSPAHGDFFLALMGKKGNWVRVVYDDADHEGWLKMARTWRFVPWEEVLIGRKARLLPGVRKEFALLRNEPAVAAPAGEAISRNQSFRIARIADDWALVTITPSVAGWLRWRDDNGRFLIMVEGAFPSQKH